MHSAGSIHNSANLSRFERKGRLLKLLLHVPVSEESQISFLPRTATVTLTRSQVSQPDLSTLNPLLVAPQNIQGLVLGPLNLGLLPTARPPAIAMLDEQMGRSDLPVLGGAGGRRVGGGAVVEGHVGLNFFRVGAGRGFPAGFLGGGVEVVG